MFSILIDMKKRQLWIHFYKMVGWHVLPPDASTYVVINVVVKDKEKKSHILGT